MSGPGHLGSPEVRGLRTPIGRDLFALFDELTRTRPWGLSDQPFPLIVLEAVDPGVDAGAYVRALAQATTRAGIPHLIPRLRDPAGTAPPAPVVSSMSAVPTGLPGTPPAPVPVPEIALLDAMSRPEAWNSGRHGFGRFRFPRSELVRSFEQAVARAEQKNAVHPESTTAFGEWRNATALLPWSRRPLRTPVWWSTVIVLFAAILGGIAQGVADRTRIDHLLVTSLALLSTLALAAGLMNRRIWLPLVSRVGYGTRYHWFATSSFFAVQGGAGLTRDLKQVLERMASEDSAEFRLQTKTYAFLEDVRAAHRRSSPSLRGFKRPVPSVLFLDGVSASNGGIEVLSAMSDVRSRRSELSPLLVVASVECEHRRDLDPIATPPALPAAPVRAVYHDWKTSLGTSQAPSQQVALPWVLRIPIPPTGAGAGDGPPPAPFRRRRRPRWTWLWSWRSLLAAMLALAVGGSYLHAQLTSAHCDVRWLFSADTDTVLRTDAYGTRECVGVATAGVRFERGPKSTALDGRQVAPDTRNRGGRITLADLQRLIDDANDKVLRSNRPYVTILYAGMLTAATGQEWNTVSSVRELAGTYLAQLANNGDRTSGLNRPLRVRLLAVNTGQNMEFAEAATDRMLTIARRDPTVIGVTGMGRNTAESRRAIDRLTKAGLALIDPVSSSDELPALRNYYGLAPTDRDEAVAARKALDGRRAGRTLIVYRSSGDGRDYSTELARDAKEVLRPAHVRELPYRDADDVGGKVREACANPEGGPYRLVYFAGRGEDLRNLVAALNAGGCTDHELTLIGGDEISRVSFGPGPDQVALPDTLTVYYTTFTYLKNLTARGRHHGNVFFTLARSILDADTAQSGASILTDGQIAITYDAADALAVTANEVFKNLDLASARDRRVPGSGSVTSGGVLLTLPSMRWGNAATGAIDFRYTHTANGPGRQGLTLLKVTSRTAEPIPVCGRMSGMETVPGLPGCPREAR